MTFLPAYLRGLGLSGREISTVFTVTPLLALVVPLAWAYLADRTQRHDRVLRVVVGGAWLGFMPMLFARQLHRHPGRAGRSTRCSRSPSAAWLTRSRSRACAPAPSTGGCACGAPSATSSPSVAVGALLSARGRAADRLVPIAMWLALGCAFVAATRLRGAGEPPRARAPPT